MSIEDENYIAELIMKHSVNKFTKTYTIEQHYDYALDLVKIYIKEKDYVKASDIVQHYEEKAIISNYYKNSTLHDQYQHISDQLQKLIQEYT